MKKTIVAAAVAALTAAPAFADVSISGSVQAEMGDMNNTSTNEVYTDVFFKASEDLGNGMKVSSVIQMIGDNAAANTAGGDRIVSLSADFGTISTGYMESYTEGSIMSMAATDPAHTISIESGFNASTAEGTRYVSPSFNGLKVGVETFNPGISTVFGEYSNAGLTVKAAQEKSGEAADAGDIDSVAVQYKIDGLTARIVHTESATEEQTFYGATYTMGANTVGFGILDSNAAGTTTGGASGGDGDYTVSLNHALSKNTNVYVAHMSDDSDSTSDETVVGIKQKF